jgi:hypothetical protein
MEEFQAAAADALSFSRSGRAIVEAFMDGPEFSVDAIVYHGEITICGLADRHIYFPPYFIEMGHTMPTVIEKEKQEAILETFCQGVRALGLAEQGSVGAAKGDIKLTSNGPMIGEIAARLSGGYMSGWTYPYSSGVEPIRAAILMAMGRAPGELGPSKNWTCAERAFISIPGTVKSIHGLEAARANVKDLFLRVYGGSKVNFPENNVSKCGNIISAAPDRNAAVEAAESAARSILIRLEPDDTDTNDFLQGLPRPASGQGPFPPDAYQINAELRTALEKLPETVHKGKEMYLYPFPQFTTSGLLDYMGRSVEESLEALRILTGEGSGSGLSVKQEVSDNKCTILGRSFWAALIRGGYQGAVYYIDQLRKNEG